LPEISFDKPGRINMRLGSGLLVGVLLSLVGWPSDGGIAQHSTTIPAGLREGGSVGTLAIDPSNPRIIYAGTQGGGVFKSLDGAASWVPASKGLINLDVRALAIDPADGNTLYAGASGIGTDAAVFKSTNGGASWKAATSGVEAKEVFALAIDPSNPSIIYAGADTGVYKSVDGGTNWAATSAGLTHRFIFSL
jgi:photosystem II stability/assembly factor-like uncharacterized protein